MKQLEKRPRWELYVDAAKRLFMWHFMQKKLGLMLVSEFPKSGGTWFCQMLSDVSNVPFQRNVNAKLIKSVLHGHLLFRPRMNKAIIVLRDGRDVMVSAYFHFLFQRNEGGELSIGAQYHRKHLQFQDYDDIKTNLPKFMEHMFTNFAQKNMTHFSWSESVYNIEDNRDRLLVVKYEELLQSPKECLKRALKFYDLEVPDEKKIDDIVEKYSFKNVTKRKQGQEDRKSFVRKGISGDWKNHFTEEACQVFKKYGGEALVLAGYEKDLSWNNSLLEK